MSEFILEHRYVQVPAEFIESFLAEANGAYVKVYLYILNLADRGGRMSTAEIAEKLSLIESDVLNALEYWKERGIIKEAGDSIIIGYGAAMPKISTDETIEKRHEYDSLKVSEGIQASSELSDMMKLAQEIFGRMLSSAEMETIYWFYDGLNFSPEAILLLLEFCVSKGKQNIKYIEKVAVSWNERGATEADRVYEIIKEDEQKNGYLSAIRKVMGISDRALSQSEEQYIVKWKDEKNMSEEMIALAYEYCIIQTAKLSFPYMDKIIERWCKQGIKDVAAAEEDNRRFKSKTASVKPENADYTDLESLTRGRKSKE